VNRLTSTHTIIIVIIMNFSFESLTTIQSLGSFKKGTKEICILGVVPNVHANNTDNDIASSYFKKWLEGSDRFCCLVTPHYSKEAKERYLQYIDKVKPTLMDMVLCTAYQHNFKYKNTSFIPTDSLLNKSQNLTNAFVNYFDAFLFNSIAQDLKLPISSVIDLEILLSKSNKLKKKFFGKKGTFGSIEKYISDNMLTHYHCNGCTIEEYYTDLQATFDHIDNCKNNLNFDDTIKNVISKRLILAKNCKKNIESLFNLYSNNTPHAYCTKALCDAMRKEQSIISILNAYTKDLGAIDRTLMCLHYFIPLVQTLDATDNIFLCADNEVALQLHSCLEELGFTKNCSGLLVSITGQAILDSGRRFNDEQLRAFFSSVFRSSACTASDGYMTNVNNSFTRYYNGKQEVVVAPLTNPCTTCLFCKQTVPSECVFISTYDSKNFCSAQCYRDFIINNNQEEHPSLKLFDPSYILQDGDRKILQRLAALTYYQYMFLLPSISSEQGPFYDLPHTKLADLSKQIRKITSQESPSIPQKEFWQNVLTLASIFGINPVLWQNILQKGQELKQDYLKQLLEYAKSNPYVYVYSAEHEKSVNFDDKEILKGTQKVLADIIKHKNVLSLLDDTENSALCRYYNELLRLIHDRLNQYTLNYEKLLTIEYEQESNQDVIALLTTFELNPTHILSGRQSKHATPHTNNLYHNSGVSNSNEPQIFNQHFELEPPPIAIDHDTLADVTELDNFILVQKRNHTIPLTRDIDDYFAGKEYYHIKLYNVRSYLLAPPSYQEALSEWKNCSSFKKAYRIKALSALADYGQSQDGVKVLSNQYDCPALDFSAHSITDYDSTLLEKLDLHHLFSRSVDYALTLFGMPELLDNNTLQVSIPGEIIYKDSTRHIGFFQYTFDINNKVCYHRCFKDYNQNLDGKYISKNLRSALYSFLKEYMANNLTYKPILQELERLQ
jgi:hypothetical protein